MTPQSIPPWLHPVETWMSGVAATWMSGVVSLALVVGSATASAAEPAPESLPGARTFVLRDLDPEPLRIHVFPADPAFGPGPRPAMIFFFGGGWSRGTPERSAGWARMAARWGMVGIAPDYRVNERHGTSPLESVADGRLALRWVQDHATELGIDPDRIAVGGSSAGGHVALWTAIPSSPPGSDAEEAPHRPPAALVLLSAVSDTSELGYTPRRFGANARALSPVHQLPPAMPPVLAFHGDADPTVPHAQAVSLDAALRAIGSESLLVSVPGEGHSIGRDVPAWKDRSRDLIRRWLAERGLASPPGP